MAEYTTGKGVWNGWSWRFVGTTVVVMAVLQLVAFYAFHYTMYASLPLAMLVISYVVIPRVQTRKLGNALAGVIASFIIGTLLELAVDITPVAQAAKQGQLPQFIELNMAFPLLLGVVMAFVYGRLTRWSERKRSEMEAKRRKESSTTATTAPVQRVHRKKKKK